MHKGRSYHPRNRVQAAGERLPVAIVSHGFMAFQDTVRQYARLLAQLGYAAYRFDFCGGSVIKGKSDGKTTEMSVMTEVCDLQAVVSYALSRPYADAEHLLLMGCSQGEFVSALAAAKRAIRVEKLILFYPAFRIPDDARAGKMMFARFDPNNIPQKLRCGPMKLGKCYVEDVIGLDPYKEIRDYPGRVLIVQGDKDRIVAPSYARRAYETYLASAPEGMPPEKRIALHILQGAKHGFSRKMDRRAMEILCCFASKEK